MKQVLLLPPFYRWQTWGLERLEGGRLDSENLENQPKSWELGRSREFNTLCWINLGTEYVKKDKKPSSHEQLGMRTSTEEDKARGKASRWFITQNSTGMEEGARGLVMPTHVPRGQGPHDYLSKQISLPVPLSIFRARQQCSHGNRQLKKACRSRQEWKGWKCSQGA